MSEEISCSKFKVAAVQSGPVIGDAPDWFDLKSSLSKAISFIAEAGKNGARLIVFSECWLPGFTYWGFDFTELATYRDLWAAYLWNSVEVPGPETEALGAAARKADAYVTIGINERDKKYPGRMYNSILYFGPGGEIIGSHRKICNTFGERLFHTPGDGGDNLKAVFKTDIGRIGGSICGEHSQLALMYNWIMQGVQVHCSLWPGLQSTKIESDICSRAFCRSSHAFGIISAGYFKERDLPGEFYKNSAFNIPGMICGGSGIVNPWGEYIAGPVYDEETIVYSDIDLSESDRARFAVNLTGNYSRWDLLSLNVKQDTYEPLSPAGRAQEPLPSGEAGEIIELKARVSQLELLISDFLSKKPEGRSKEG